jgi:superfamily I DNA/RNA helicase
MELLQANDLLRSELRKNTALLSLGRRYNERGLMLDEIALSDNIILRKRLGDAEILLRARQQCKNGEHIKLKDKYVFSTQEVLEIAKEAEAQDSHKKSRRQPRKPIGSAKIDSDE